MPKSWAGGWVAGALVVLFAHVVWVTLVVVQVHAEWLTGAIITLSFVTSNAAGLGAFVTALRTPAHGFLLGLGMAPLAALLAVVSHLAVRLADVHIELAGIRGIFGLLAATLLYGLFVAMVGGAIGAWARRRAAHDAQPWSVPPAPTDATSPGPPTG
jgi:hypothetical protein